MGLGETAIGVGGDTSAAETLGAETIGRGGAIGFAGASAGLGWGVARTEAWGEGRFTGARAISSRTSVSVSVLDGDSALSGKGIQSNSPCSPKERAMVIAAIGGFFDNF
jgi:hypothetical protein